MTEKQSISSSDVENEDFCGFDKNYHHCLIGEFRTCIRRI